MPATKRSNNEELAQDKYLINHLVFVVRTMQRRAADRAMDAASNYRRQQSAVGCQSALQVKDQNVF